MYNHLIYFKMERNYLEKVHQNNIKSKSKRGIQTTWGFNISNLIKKRYQNDHNFLPFKITSKYAQKNTPKQRWFFVQRSQVKKSTSKRRRYFAHRSYAEQSTSKQRWFFAHQDYIENVRQNDEGIGNLSIFCFRRIDAIST